MTDKELAEERAAKFTDINFNEPDNYGSAKEVGHFSYCAGFLAGLKAGRPKWHKLDWEKDFPDVDKLVRIRTKSGAEYICKTYDYWPAEDEIGHGSVIIQFSELNGDWVDDNEIEYWCEIPQFKEEPE